MNGSSADRAPPGGPLKLQPTPKTVQGTAGEVVTVELMLLNRSEEDPSHAPIVDVGALPEGWTVVGRNDFGGTWRPSTREWFWWGLAPEEKVRPTLDVRIPEAVEPGEYTLSASVDDGNDDGDSATVRLRVTPMGKGKKGENRGKGKKGENRGKGKKGENRGKGKGKGRDGDRGERKGRGEGRDENEGKDDGKRRGKDGDEGTDGDRGNGREKGDRDGRGRGNDRGKGRDGSSDGKDEERGGGENSGNDGDRGKGSNEGRGKGNGKGDPESGGAVGSLVGWLTDL